MPHPAEALAGRKGARLAGRRVALGVDGGADAPDAVRVARELLRHGARVSVLATPAALRRVHAEALEYASGVAPEVWPPATGREPELLVLVGIAEDTRRKASAGIVDTALAGLLARRIPAVEHGGDPEETADRAMGALARGPLRAKTVLVVAGSSREPWDAVRGVATRASTAAGVAFARELARAGARVTLAAPRDADERACLQGRIQFATRHELRQRLGRRRFDFAVVEDNQPPLAPDRVPGKLPSGGTRALRLSPLPSLPSALRNSAGRVVKFRTHHDAGEVLGAIDVRASAESRGSAEAVGRALARALEERA